MAKKRMKMNWACERALHAIKGKGKMCLVGPQPTASVGITEITGGYYNGNNERLL
jgi:hypothetical protein